MSTQGNESGPPLFLHLLFDLFLFLHRLEIVVDVLERDIVVSEILLGLPAPGAGAEGVHRDVFHRCSSSLTNIFPSWDLHLYVGTVISLAVEELARGDVELPLVTRALKRVAVKPAASKGARHVSASVPERVDVPVFLYEDD